MRRLRPGRSRIPRRTLGSIGSTTSQVAKDGLVIMYGAKSFSSQLELTIDLGLPVSDYSQYLALES